MSGVPQPADNSGRGTENAALTFAVINDLAVKRAEAQSALATALNNEVQRLCWELRKSRESLGLTQQQVAETVGLSRAQVANIEGGRGVSVESLVAIAAVLGSRLVLSAVSS